MGIPVIDFSKLINHEISEELLDRVKKVATECYKLEREAKFRDSRPVQLLNELVEENSDAEIENVDWEDVFLLSDKNDEEWPSKTAGFKKTMKEYRVELKKLGHKVMEIMDENLGLPKGYIKNAFDGGVDNAAFFGTKVSHYPPCPHPEKVNALRAHRDAGGIVLLFQDDEVKGLQMLKDRTDGQRRSIVSFYNPSLKATIAPATQLLNAKVENNVRDMAKYPKFMFGDYIFVYLEQKVPTQRAKICMLKMVLALSLRQDALVEHMYSFLLHIA
ncbi:1-aminocyclopropane-1-carboxylate oxidase 5 [Sesamum alatum]|uniref:1-aminocyclopropane-1-carboxylate oxidase 5 n=1 Tax=Sesamum alatum TaxID=300844 RepID=A0AAE1XXX8_9LAMI|nr:1-aminocyclopropane-1-carboxylate oxidase 5 [Sesamum alatum]